MGLRKKERKKTGRKRKEQERAEVGSKFERLNMITIMDVRYLCAFHRYSENVKLYESGYKISADKNIYH